MKLNLRWSSLVCLENGSWQFFVAFQTHQDKSVSVSDEASKMMIRFVDKVRSKVSH